MSSPESTRTVECIEPGCDRPRWAAKVRGKSCTLSDRCYQHANVPLFDPPPRVWKPKPKGPRSFRDEVRRQRLDRERPQPATDGLEARPVGVDHPARFSVELLPVLARPLADWRLPVHDPFAGTGERLGQLCDQLGLTFTGTEIEPEFIVDHRVREGDSTGAGAYPSGEYVIATSPTYPNGMADHFKASDDSRRHTYRQALQRTRGGRDRELHPNNTGRYNIRRGDWIEAQYWRLVRTAVAHWPGRAVVNVKDFYYQNDKIYRLVAKWTALLEEYGYEVADPTEVKTPGQRHGANRQRVEAEAVLTCERATARREEEGRA